MEDKIIHMFYQIIEDCDNLQSDDVMTVTDYGFNKDLTLYIVKDSDYKADEDKFNIVFITTKQNDITVDDSGDIHISELYNTLERIYNYKNLSTL